jgi:hypothetical protein
MYLVLSMTAVIFTGITILYEFLIEDTGNLMKELMEYEKEYSPKRRNVIKGMFRQHNAQFRDQGFTGPKGTA